MRGAIQQSPSEPSRKASRRWRWHMSSSTPSSPSNRTARTSSHARKAAGPNRAPVRGASEGVAAECLAV